MTTHTFPGGAHRATTNGDRTGYDAEPPVHLRAQGLRRPKPAVEVSADETSGEAPVVAHETTDFPAQPVTATDTSALVDTDPAYTGPVEDTSEGEPSPYVITAENADHYHDVAEYDDVSVDDELAAADYADHSDASDVVDEPLGAQPPVRPGMWARVAARVPDRRRAAGWVPDVRSSRDKVQAASSRIVSLVRGNGRLLALSCGVVAVAAVLAVLVGTLVHSVGGDSAPTDPVAALASVDPTSDAVECPTKTDGPVSTGRGAGGQSTAVEVIKAFNFAYYQWRNAAAARAMVSANGTVGNVVDMQAAIDVLSPKVRYCVAATDTGNNTFRVALTEFSPGGGKRVINQIVRTDNFGGRWWITGFAKPTR